MRILISHEFSGILREACRRLGHEAISCDLLPTEIPGPHYQGSVFDIIGQGFDAHVAFPPCTYVCSSGLHWNKRVPGRAEKTEAALLHVERGSMRWATVGRTRPGPGPCQRSNFFKVHARLLPV